MKLAAGVKPDNFGEISLTNLYSSITGMVENSPMYLFLTPGKNSNGLYELSFLRGVAPRTYRLTITTSEISPYSPNHLVGLGWKV